MEADGDIEQARKALSEDHAPGLNERWLEPSRR